MNRPSDSSQSKAMTIKPYSRLTSLPIHSENIFHFPDGLPAFEYVKEFLFIFKPETSPFLFMHALKPADLAFVCIDPFLIYQDYKPTISGNDVDSLDIQRPEDLLLLSIVTVTPNQKDITANLQGPIAINMQTLLGKQILCEGHNYPIRYRIWDALNKASETEDENLIRFSQEKSEVA